MNTTDTHGHPQASLTELLLRCTDLVADSLGNTPRIGFSHIRHKQGELLSARADE